jgi:lipopolysaccharide/colanic/teichoic acid biosynthesis glycosyltransferase
MELAYLPKNRVAGKTYKHFTVNSYPVNTTVAEKKTEFFYIGKNSQIIDSLVEFFEGGYAAENADKAMSILTRVSEKRNVQPGVIIVDAALGTYALHVIQNFLSASSNLSSIPLMVEISCCSGNEVNDLRKLSFIDDIIDLRQCDRKLITRINFISKIKDYNNHKDLQKNIQQTGQKTVSAPGRIAKRGFDILVSSTILLALSPVLALIAIAIKMESRGPVFYIAKRAGRGYRIFNFFKFRTMEVNADKKVEQLTHLNQYSADGSKGPVFFKVSNDPRITKVGAFLRNTSLDEFPQLINVLLGDMSLVGNRPLPLYEAQTLTTDDWATRFMAPAGMTGLWQIKKRGQKDMSVEERISLDIDYAHRNNFMYDLWIMANTPTALIQKSNA